MEEETKMKKKLLIMAGAFIAGATAVTGLRHYLVKTEKEKLASFDDDYEDEDDEIDDFGFDEDLDLDFDPDEEPKVDHELLEDAIVYVASNSKHLTGKQIDYLKATLKLKNMDDMLAFTRKGGANE